MRTNNLAVFILTHRRPDRVLTYKTLKRQGYTGDIYLIVDDEDPTLSQYQANYGDEVIVFSKSEAATYTDDIDLYGNKASVVYARNACWRIAENLGLEYFLQLDDDYTTFTNVFSISLVPVNANREQYVADLDSLFGLIFNYLDTTSITCLAIAQSGDFIGGTKNGTYTRSVRTKRKAMNSFFCSVKRPFNFVGILNDDVNTYVTLSNRGYLFLTIMQVRLHQSDTQQRDGGLTDLYLESGTYVKSFYTVMMQPSSVHIYEMGVNHKRLHHWIDAKTTYPKIISEDYRKASEIF